MITVSSIIYLAMTLLVLSVVFPMINNSINTAWPYLNPAGKVLAAFIPIAILLGVIKTALGPVNVVEQYREPPQY